jgi:hypothetical protein
LSGCGLVVFRRFTHYAIAVALKQAARRYKQFLVVHVPDRADIATAGSQGQIRDKLAEPPIGKSRRSSQTACINSSVAARFFMGSSHRWMETLLRG